jgi:hypothetical protein
MLVLTLPSGADGCILHLSARSMLQPLHGQCLLAVRPLRCVNGHSKIKELLRERSGSRKRADAAAAGRPKLARRLGTGGSLGVIILSPHQAVVLAIPGDQA